MKGPLAIKKGCYQKVKGKGNRVIWDSNNIRGDSNTESEESSLTEDLG